MKVLLKDMAGESNIRHRAASDPPCSLKSGTHYLHRTFESRRHNSMASFALVHASRCFDLL
jgi:hypothetical protein